MVRGWQSEKIGNGKGIKKNRRIEEILVSLICVRLEGGNVEEWKTFLFGWKEKWEDKKYLYKFTHMPLLKNDAQFKK